MKLKLALIMIFIIGITGSIYLYIKKDFKKEIEFVSWKPKKDNIDYSKYRQPTPKIKKTKITSKNKFLTSKKTTPHKRTKIKKRTNKKSEREKAKIRLKKELDKQMLQAISDVN